MPGHRSNDRSQERDLLLGYLAAPCYGRPLPYRLHTPAPRHRIGIVTRQVLREAGYCRMIKDRDYVYDLAEPLLESVDEDGARNGAATQFEERVMDPHLLCAHGLPPEDH